MSFSGPGFPSIAATSRSLVAGDFPGTTFAAQNGVQVRVQYGNQRSNVELSLSFDNITDANAALIYDHYVSCRGTLGVFDVAANSLALSGNPGFHSGAATGRFSVTPYGMKYRYAEPPQFNSIKPGRMSATIKLVGVLDK